MKKAILFGAGHYGKFAYYKLKEHYDIMCYVDNNLALKGKTLHELNIISAEELKNIYVNQEMDLIICVEKYSAIESQLISMGIQDYYIVLEGFLYHSNSCETLIPVELIKTDYYKKAKQEKNILFVQNTACIRTHKIAKIMKECGYKVFLLYSFAPPIENNYFYADVYDKMFTFFSIASFVDFVENSKFDIVHSSNDPDMLTNLLLLTNKKIVFDTHDMNSLRGLPNTEALILEYIANKKSAGRIYTSELVVEIAKRKFNLQNTPILALENMVLEQVPIKQYQRKLSNIDGAIHCVYEGGIIGNNKEHFRYFEDIWKRITDCGIHIHFYSQLNTEYCRELEKKSEYLHYEGNFPADKIVEEMTKYDCGLAIFNVSDKNRSFLESGTANKMYEYINAAIPVIVGDVNSYVDFVNKYQVGIQLDLSKDVYQQISEACNINVDKDFLNKHQLTMKSRSNELVQFYENIINSNE